MYRRPAIFYDSICRVEVDKQDGETPNIFKRININKDFVLNEEGLYVCKFGYIQHRKMKPYLIYVKKFFF